MRRRRGTKQNSEWSRSRILILAVTFFAAAGLGTLGINAISRVGQVAAAGLTRTSPDSCDVARQKALGKDNDGPATDTFTGEGDGAQTLSKCYGAIITEEGKKARDDPARYGPLQAIEKHYKCTGRESGTVTVDKGIVTSVSTASGSPGKCPEKVINKGLKDKGKGEPPKDDKKKDDGKGKGGEGKAPEIPPPPEKKPKQEQPKDEKCMQDPNAPECEQAQRPFYCSIPGSSLFSSKCSEDAHLPQTPSPTGVDEALSNLAESPAAPGLESSEAPVAQSGAVTEGVQRIETGGPKSVSERIAQTSPSPQPDNNYAPPESTGFTALNTQTPLNQEERSAAWWTLEGLRNGLVKWLNSWR